MKLRELELEQAQPLANAQKEKQEIEEQIARLESLIERRKCSLAEWLDRNKPAWKDTIGKIADEEKILYRNDLAPQVTNQGEASLYGVQIDLTALERNFRTPEELKAELAIYQGALSQCVKRINMLHQELAEQTEALKKQYKNPNNFSFPHSSRTPWHNPPHGKRRRTIGVNSVWLKSG